MVRFSLKKLLYYYVYFTIIYQLLRNLSPLDKGFLTDLIPPLDYLSSLVALLLLPLLFYRYGISRNVSIVSLLIFMLTITLGSVYSLFFKNYSVGQTFLSRALNMLQFFPFYYFFLVNFKRAKLNDVMQFVRFYGKVALIVSTIMSVILIIYVLMGKPPYKKPGEEIYYTHIYHEEIALIVLSALLVNIFRIPSLLKKFAQLFYLSMGIVIWKNTGFAITTLVLISAFLKRLFKYKALTRILIYHIMVAGMVIFVYFIVYLYTHYYHYLPSGSLDVRIVTYSKRLGEFLSSPLFGYFFTGSSTMDIGWLRNIPSHSDFLDLLSQLGILGMFISFWIIYPLLKVSTHVKILRKCPQYFREFYMYSLVLAYAILIESFVNPIFGQNRLSFFFWFALAVLISFQRFYSEVCRGYSDGNA